MKNRTGVISRLACDAGNPREVIDYDLDSYRFVSWTPYEWTDELATKLVEMVEETGIGVTGRRADWSRPEEWNFTQGPSPLGIVSMK